jgi:ATP-dependent Lon protease
VGRARGGRPRLSSHSACPCVRAWQVALSCVRVHWDDLVARLGPPVADLLSSDYEVMVSVGGFDQVKTGVSSGLACALAIVRGAFDLELYSSVGVTGEITMAGAVLPISGLNIKLGAVVASGKTHFILPHENLHDYWDQGPDGKPKRVTTQRPQGLLLVGVKNFLNAVDLAFPPRGGGESGGRNL